MKHWLGRVSVAVCACVWTVGLQAAEEVPLGSLDLTRMLQGWEQPQVDLSVTSKPLSIAGRKFEHGVGTHAESALWVDLDGGTERFKAWVGLDDGANGPGSVEFRIYADGRRLFSSGIMRPGSKAIEVDLPLDGKKSLLLKVTTADGKKDYDHADWADAKFIVAGAKPKATDAPSEEKVILTPKPGPKPRINGPGVYGCRPGASFIYRIPCTGERPVKFSAEKMPSGLQLDSSSGIITGTAPERGEYRLVLHARNARGEALRKFTIVSGDTIALTPYMGWNHWYAFYDRISDKLMRSAADAMIENGMADFGYSYVCIDDCWSRLPENTSPELGGQTRDDQGRILPNAKFPDMNALTDYIHGKGLKAGIYTSPGSKTCMGYAGSYGYEAQDAAQFAEWGFDLVKYDWCSYGKVVGKKVAREEAIAPYALMGKLLASQKRDIVYNLCQYGRENVWEWGADVHAHSWRTSGDLGVELDRFFAIAEKNAKLRAWNRPGLWNDPDYIQIGYIGDAWKKGLPTPTAMTPSEQYSFMSLWSMLAVPLVLSNDITRMDDFTLNVLCNAEVLEINQDSLGQCAALTSLIEDCFMLVKELEDGTKAVALCNSGEMDVELTASWPAVGLRGKQRLRDLWRQNDLGVFEREYAATVPRHGVVLFRASPVK